MSGTAYWNKQIRQADRVSPKTGAEKRIDRLRGQLRGLDPVQANRAWRDLGDAVDQILNRYSK